MGLAVCLPSHEEVADRQDIHAGADEAVHGVFGRTDDVYVFSDFGNFLA